jgi:hypothetical protein
MVLSQCLQMVQGCHMVPRQLTAMQVKQCFLASSRPLLSRAPSMSAAAAQGPSPLLGTGSMSRPPPVALTYAGGSLALLAVDAAAVFLTAPKLHHDCAVLCML